MYKEVDSSLNHMHYIFYRYFLLNKEIVRSYLTAPDYFVHVYKANTSIIILGRFDE